MEMKRKEERVKMKKTENVLKIKLKIEEEHMTSTSLLMFSTEFIR